jgi:integrase
VHQRDAGKTHRHARLYTHVLSIPLNRLADFTRAKRPVRVPVVATPSEVAAVLGRLEGAPALIAALLYGAGRSLLDCAHLRTKDLDFERLELVVRDGKGRKDRITVLPQSLGGALGRSGRRFRGAGGVWVSGGAGRVGSALGRPGVAGSVAEAWGDEGGVRIVEARWVGVRDARPIWAMVSGRIFVVEERADRRPSGRAGRR